MRSLNNRWPSRLLVLTTLAFLAAAPAVRAQSFSRVEETRSNSTSYYFYVQPGAATVQVYVMGTVRSPGVYEVTEGTDLGKLLALSGGPLLDQRQRTTDREVTIRLFRPRQYGERPLYEAVMDRAVSRPENYPVLQDGDVLTVEIVERQRFGWRDAFTILGGVAAIAFAVESVVQISR
jgi:hypothetical protein